MLQIPSLFSAGHNTFNYLSKGYPSDGLVGVPASTRHTTLSLPPIKKSRYYCAKINIKISKKPAPADNCCTKTPDCDYLNWYIEKRDGCCECPVVVRQKLCLPNLGIKDLKEPLLESFRYSLNSFARLKELRLESSNATSATYQGLLEIDSDSKVYLSTDFCCEGLWEISASLVSDFPQLEAGCIGQGLALVQDICNPCNPYYGVPRGTATEVFLGVSAKKVQLSPGCCTSHQCQNYLVGDVIIPLECPVVANCDSPNVLFYRTESTADFPTRGMWRIANKGTTIAGMRELPQSSYRIISRRGNRAMVYFLG
jgi:hypothetical protein